uniref:THUMP domain-containing protein n=1 Tax=Steinernema glaseri TaxID=37863 RepID=A0A1I7ZI32_9BILA
MRDLLFNPAIFDLVWTTLQGPKEADLFECKISSELRAQCYDAVAEIANEELHSFVTYQKGCFVLMATIEHCTEKARQAVKVAVKPCFLSQYNNKGAGVLLKKLLKH